MFGCNGNKSCELRPCQRPGLVGHLENTRSRSCADDFQSRVDQSLTTKIAQLPGE